MRKSGTFLILNLIFTAALSQNNLNELTVDRPGIADTPFTVPQGMYQFEVGFDYFNRSNGIFYNMPTALFRTGITKRIEARIALRQILDHTDGSSFNGISSISAGFKSHVIKQNRWIPETDVMLNLIVPIVYSSLSKTLGYEALILFQNDFYPNTAINYNVGYLWDYNLNKPMFTASFCYNYLPTQRLGLFIEYFDFVPNSRLDEQGFDGGFTYLLAPKFQVDLSCGVSRQEEKNNFFVSTGFSFRLGKNRPQVHNPTGRSLGTGDVRL